MKIDAHQHFWQCYAPDRSRIGPQMAILSRIDYVKKVLGTRTDRCVGRDCLEILWIRVECEGILHANLQGRRIMVSSGRNPWQAHQALN